MPFHSPPTSMSYQHRTPRLLLAMDKFKGTLTSREASEALRRGLEQWLPTATIATLAVADGGEGTVDAAVTSGYERRSFVVSGPVGEPVTTDVAIRGKTAMVEVATVCGLQQLPFDFKRPLDSTSRGVGELLLALAESGSSTIVLGLGGSATTDGGVGMLCALGARFLDESGVPLPPGGGALARLASIDWRGLDPLVSDLDIVIASDVDSPLLGRNGAAHMFGPQKGADEAMVELLEDGLKNLVSVLSRCPSPHMSGSTAKRIAIESGAGAAGGLGFGGRLVGSRIVSGARLVLDLLDLRSLVKEADLVITGEGCLDRQSLQGKVPVAIARIAAEEGVPTAAVVGQSRITEAEWPAAQLISVWSMNHVDKGTVASAFKSREVLGLIGAQIGAVLANDPDEKWTDMQNALHASINSSSPNPVQKD
jgi:glycerate kinase